ncbi:MAG: GIY-YIG nuclease family protein [Xanthobacteraceae bacterium]
MPAHVYVLASKRNGTLYVGVTTDLPNRITAHKHRLIPGFTKRYGVDKLVHVETYESILEARARERSLKRWNRAWKLQLIERENPDWNDLSDLI